MEKKFLLKDKRSKKRERVCVRKMKEGKEYEREYREISKRKVNAI